MLTDHQTYDQILFPPKLIFFQLLYGKAYWEGVAWVEPSTTSKVWPCPTPTSKRISTVGIIKILLLSQHPGVQQHAHRVYMCTLAIQLASSPGHSHVFNILHVQY